ncbi:MAG: hypothetical protein AAB972_00975 [Patescibacteria group bacterium]
MNPEKQHNTRREQTADLDRMWQWATETIEAKQISPERFRGFYDGDMIDRDLAYVRRRKEEIKKGETPESEESKKLATIFEAIVHEGIERFGWLGPDASSIRSSEYDDLKGVDGIVRFRHEGEGDAHLGLAMDVTYGSEIKKKMDRTKEDIDNGHLAEITYFISPADEGSERPEYMGKLQVPRVVVGLNAPVVRELAELWMHSGNNEKIASHMAQELLAGEILAQLTYWADYAKQTGKTYIAAIYRRAAVMLERNLKLKKQQSKRDEKQSIPQHLKEDRVYKTIQEYLEEARY